jgi:hypothetical protein
LDNRKIKILEPNKGKHIAIVGDINTILASKEDTGGTYSFIEAKVFPGGGPKCLRDLVLQYQEHQTIINNSIAKSK